jgi:hypothetical protein
MSLKKILVGNASCHDFSCICWASPLLGHRFGNGQLSSNGMQRSVAVKNPFLQHVRWDDAVCLSEKHFRENPDADISFRLYPYPDRMLPSPKPTDPFDQIGMHREYIPPHASKNRSTVFHPHRQYIRALSFFLHDAFWASQTWPSK